MSFNIFFFKFSNWHVVVPLKKTPFLQKEISQARKKTYEWCFLGSLVGIKLKCYNCAENIPRKTIGIL